MIVTNSQNKLQISLVIHSIALQKSSVKKTLDELCVKIKLHCNSLSTFDKICHLLTVHTSGMPGAYTEQVSEYENQYEEWVNLY